MGQETADGQACYVFEGKLPINVKQMMGAASMENMKVWMAKSDGVSRKMEGQAADGSSVLSMTFSNVKTNLALSTDQFVFTPPEGAQVIDMSEAVKNMMKSMQQPAPSAGSETKEP